MLRTITTLLACIALSMPVAHAADLPDGKKLFEANCAGCHGADGTVSDYGRKLEPFPARNLRAVAPYVSADELRRIITHGTHKTAMRPMKYKLDPFEIEAVVDYILSFDYSANKANGEQDAAILRATIADGRKIMPKYGKKFDAEQIDALVAYIQEQQKKIIFDWIEAGKDVDKFNDKVAPIFNESCVMCHSEASGMGLPPLTNYEEVLKLTEMDTGASIQSLVRVSHIHLFGIAFILFLVGRIFILCEMPIMVKRITVAIPFIAMLLDIFSWYITKVFPGFAYVVVISGALMGIAFSIQILVSLYQMWFYKPKTVPIEM